jgi:hypothetical protein
MAGDEERKKLNKTGNSRRTGKQEPELEATKAQRHGGSVFKSELKELGGYDTLAV